MKTSRIAIVSGLTAAVTLTGLGAYGMASAAEKRNQRVEAAAAAF